jgi:membrane protein
MKLNEFFHKNIYKRAFFQSKSTYSDQKQKLAHLLKLFLLAAENYTKTRSNLWAAALSFYSLLSIVPIIAIAFGIAKNFGVEELVKQQILKNFPLQEQILQRIFILAQRVLDNTKGGIIAGTGLLFLLWSVIKIFSLVEKSFNEIWKVKKARTIIRKLTDYLSIVILLPIIVVATNVISTYFEIHTINLNGIAVSSLKFLPYLLFCLFLTLIYMIIPNTRVKPASAFIGGLIAGILLQILQTLYIKLQLGILNYNKIYGSFSILPIFFIWQRLTWLFVLLGAHVSFVTQNSYKYTSLVKLENLNYYSKRSLVFLMTYIFVKNYEEDKPILTTELVAENLGLSISLVQEILNLLVELQVVIEVSTSEEIRAYQMNKNINQLTLSKLNYLLEKHGLTELPVLDENLKRVECELDRFIKENQLDVLLKEI